jgi:hypothetical protein
MKYIAQHNNNIAHILNENEIPLCGATINRRKWGYIEKTDILFPGQRPILNRRPPWRLCSFCEKKL